LGNTLSPLGNLEKPLGNPKKLMEITLSP